MTPEQRGFVRGARDMLRESAKQFRLNNDSGHAKLADMHAQLLHNMLKPKDVWSMMTQEEKDEYWEWTS